MQQFQRQNISARLQQLKTERDEIVKEIAELSILEAGCDVDSRAQSFDQDAEDAEIEDHDEVESIRTAVYSKRLSNSKRARIEEA